MSVGENALNNLSTLFFFWLYWELSENTFRQDEHGNYVVIEKSTPWLQPIACVVLLAIGEATVLGQSPNNPLRYAFPLVGGIAAAIGMALFVGRMESKYIGPPSAVIAVLYGYAAIQPLFFDNTAFPRLGLVMFSVALVLKLVMFVFVSWLMTEGRLLFYARRINEVELTLAQDYRDFAQRHFPPGNYGTGTARRLYLAIPTHLEDADSAVRKETIESTVKRLGAVHEVETYCATVADKPTNNSATALTRDIDQLRACDVFLMIYPGPIHSSTLVEAGMALSLGKTCLFFVRSEDNLPFLLRGAKSRHRCRIEEFRWLGDLPQYLEDNWKTLVSGAQQ